MTTNEFTLEWMKMIGDHENRLFELEQRVRSLMFELARLNSGDVMPIVPNNSPILSKVKP